MTVSEKLQQYPLLVRQVLAEYSTLRMRGFIGCAVSAMELNSFYDHLNAKYADCVDEPRRGYAPIRLFWDRTLPLSQAQEFLLIPRSFAMFAQMARELEDYSEHQKVQGRVLQ